MSTSLYKLSQVDNLVHTSTTRPNIGIVFQVDMNTCRRNIHHLDGRSRRLDSSSTQDYSTNRPYCSRVCLEGNSRHGLRMC